uniref:Uncharacterized protein n=1 Tax=Pyxicephalus adspersus TaxID=30357 RepID=A0AAV2ZYF2_PYXAD|nr:TPA: hypothetical protein GDO54_014519 [Pyxicephalus adspersus]
MALRLTPFPKLMGASHTSISTVVNVSFSFYVFVFTLKTANFFTSFYDIGAGSDRNLTREDTFFVTSVHFVLLPVGPVFTLWFATDTASSMSPLPTETQTAIKT